MTTLLWAASPGELDDRDIPCCADCGGEDDGALVRWETDDGRIEWAHFPSCAGTATPHAAELATAAA